MSWWKYSKEEHNEDLDKRIKETIRQSPFFISLFKKFKVPIEKLDLLRFTTDRLEDEFCKADDERVVIDDRLANSDSFFADDFHFMAHELIHWLHRQLEDKQFFADPEEIESFNAAIAFRLNQDGSIEKVYKKFLPLIKIHFDDDNKAREFLMSRIKDAKKLLSEL